jgi:hypothetical protein
MNLADVFTFLFVILGFVIVFNAYWLMAIGLFPEFVERCAERMVRPVRATFVGLFTFVPAVVLGFTISNKAGNVGVKMLGLGLVLAAALVALFGSAGLALRIGRGLRSTLDEQQPWRAGMRGGLVLALTFVLPFLGTFVLMPFAFIAGAGAFILARRRQEQLAPAAAPAAAASVLSSPTP